MNRNIDTEQICILVGMMWQQLTYILRAGLSRFVGKYIENQLLQQFIVCIPISIILFIDSLLGRYIRFSIFGSYWHAIPLFFTISWCYQEGHQYWPVLICLFYCLKQHECYFRFWPGLMYEEFRYEEIKKKINNIFIYWGFCMVANHIIPTIIIYLGYLPLYYVITDTAQYNYLQYLGAAISILAMIIQWIADYQLQSFEKKELQGNCEVGLWNYCRHPNYFAEFLYWWGMYISVLSFGVSYFILGLGALAISIMIFKYSIPNLEQHLLGKMPSYKKYQEEVSCFIPWFRKRSKLH